ncbi:DEAD/DEAH box helicase [Thalassobacillus hwangdonensis]
MQSFPSETEIEKSIDILIHKFNVPSQLFLAMVGKESFHRMNDVLTAMDQPKLTDERLLRTLLVSKGADLFAGSDDATRKLRAYLLKQLDDETLLRLLKRNPIKGKRIQSPSYVPNALAKKKWMPGSVWPRDFIKTLGLPLIFSGVKNAATQAKEPIMDIHPRKKVPPLVDYQVGLKNRMLEVLRMEGDRTRCVVTLPTGGGKTRVAVESFIDWMQPRFNEGKYMIWIAQSQELCEQAIQCITDMWQNREFPEALRVYRYFSGAEVKPNDLIGGVVVASIQQLYSRVKKEDEVLDELLSNCGAMIIDEAHHATAMSYEQLFLRARELTDNQLFPICGLTATPGRSNEETVALVDTFEAYLIHPELPEMKKYNDNPLRYFREQGYLATPNFLLHQYGKKYELTEDELDGSQEEVHTDFLRVLAEDEERNFHIIETMRNIPEGSSTLVYGCTVEHSAFLSMVMNALGRKSACITGTTPKSIRQMHIHAFKNKEIEFLFNFGVLTTGFDAPKTDHLLITRPTSSIILYEQMVGRGLRGPRFGGTAECNIIDFSGNIFNHGQPLAYARFVREWDLEVKDSQMEGVRI